MNSIEPVLQEDKNRFVIFPVKHHDIWDWYKEMEACFWTASEIDLHQDLNDWNNKLGQNERAYIRHLLAFLAMSHPILNQDLSKKSEQEVQYPEARFFYGLQVMMENVHAETYSLLTATYVEDDHERNNLFKSLNNSPGVLKKVQWAVNYSNSESFAERLIATAVSKRILSASAFCSFSWLKNRGLMPGLSFSNELISRDQSEYGNFAIHLHNQHLIKKVPNDRIRKIILEAFKIEEQFIIESLPVNLIGLNAKLMTGYLEFVADELLTEFNCEKEFNTSNPFDFMDEKGQRNQNFFTKRVGAYQKAAMINKDTDTNTIHIKPEFNR